MSTLTARNYEAIKQIRANAAELPDEFQQILVRMFNRLDSNNMYAASLSSCVAMIIALKRKGISADLILGTVEVEGYRFFHSWIESDEKIIDLDIYFDTLRNPTLTDKVSVVKPQVCKEYRAADIRYYAFQFDDIWKMSEMKQAVGKSFFDYCNNCSDPAEIWCDIAYILNESLIKSNLDEYMTIGKELIIKDTD